MSWNALKLAAAIAASFMVTGCVNMSGISGSTDSFSCKAPEGIPCTSVSGTYANAVQNNLPGAKKAALAAQVADASQIEKPTRRVGMVPGSPLRSPSRSLRVWFAPNEDTDRDFWDERYCYMVVDSGRWMVEHSRAGLAEHYRPAMPTPKAIPVDIPEPVAETAPAQPEVPEPDKGDAAGQPVPGGVNNVQ
jgi:conjugal transfer pilus assembly protein TraV